MEHWLGEEACFGYWKQKVSSNAERGGLRRVGKGNLDEGHLSLLK